MAYKVGDRVRIKEDLCIHDDVYHLNVTNKMVENKGRICTVREIDIDGDYLLDEVSGVDYFSDDMLEPVEDSSESKFKVGDRVKVKDDLVVNKQYNNGCSFASPMKEYCGKEFTVMDVREIVPERIRYLLNTSYDWRFSDDMLELVDNFTLESSQNASDELIRLIRHIREVINHEVLKVEFYSSEVDFILFETEAIVTYSKANDRIFFDASNRGLTIDEVAKMKEVMELLNSSKDMLCKLLTK